MKEILEKLKSIVLSLEKEHGPILIFALFLGEDSPEQWDVVVSASWLSSSELSDYKTITSKIQEVMTSSELMQFSRVVILDADDSVVSFLQESFSVTNGHIQEVSVEVLAERFKFTIKRAYLLRCQKI
jgi:hypothetical protein